MFITKKHIQLFLSLFCLLLTGITACSNNKMTDEEFRNLCRTGTPEQIQQAIKSGIDVNKSAVLDGYSGVPPLMVTAAANKNPEVKNFLLKRI